MKQQRRTPTTAASSRTALSPLFAEAVARNSNLEMDWLWTAEQVTRVHEKRSALERALYINPHNQRTARALRRLRATRTTTTGTVQAVKSRPGLA